MGLPMGLLLLSLVYSKVHLDRDLIYIYNLFPQSYKL